MTDTNEQRWREECSKLEIPNQSVYDNFEWFYIKGRKKAHSEREDAFKAFTLDLVDRHEKEIEKRDKLLEQAKEYMFNSTAYDTYNSDLKVKFLKDFQEMKK